MAAKYFSCVIAACMAFSFSRTATADTNALANMATHGATAMFKLEERRMNRDREASIAALTANMTMRSALAILKSNPKATPELLSMVAGRQTGNSKAHAFLGADQHAKSPPADKGYSGVDKARNMLNEMLNEVNAKYDTETQRCRGFFEQQCSVMETVRQDIAASNAAAADARSRILASQQEINYCEVQLPQLRHDLEKNERLCYEKITDLQDSLKIVLDDIEVMVRVLEMTDCEANKSKTSLIQDARIVHCNCSGQGVVQFKHSGLQAAMAQLKSPQIRGSVLASLKSLAGQEPELGGGGFETLANVTNFTNPPMPQTEIPPNPCAGIKFDDAAVEGVGKCSVSSNPQCYKIQDKFLDIQSGIEDKRDELTEEIEETETRCKSVKETLESEIAGFETNFQNRQQELAEATSQENEAGEAGRMKMEEHNSLAQDMFQTREVCSTNMRTFESEQCALKKIRGELSKIQGDNHPAFFQDCEVSEWSPGECSVTCGGGTQVLTRTVTTQPFKGTECPPLEATQACGLDPCPVDCEVADWSEWSSCSADCDGGVKQRTRAVTTQPQNGGEPCGDTSESVACNVQACDVDCVLADWTPWSNCSKGCGGGTRHRVKDVVTPEVGQGTCPGEEDQQRFEIEPCNLGPCLKPIMEQPIHCDAKVDVILMLDGSGSVGADGWNATKKFADIFISAFEGGSANAQFSVITYSGPATWSSYVACHQDPNVDMKSTCGIDKVQDFDADLAATRERVRNLEWPTGTTFTSMALLTAYTELSLSREDAPTIVVLVTDGKPLSPRNTHIVAQYIKRRARLLVVPVQGKGLTEEDRDNMLPMVSEPQADNFVAITDFTELFTLQTIDKIVANLCPALPMLELPGFASFSER